MHNQAIFEASCEGFGIVFSVLVLIFSNLCHLAHILNQDIPHMSAEMGLHVLIQQNSSKTMAVVWQECLNPHVLQPKAPPASEYMLLLLQVYWDRRFGEGLQV